MKKIRLQIYLLLSVLLASFIIFNMITSTNVINQKLFTGLAILIMLFILRIINNLSDNTYGDYKEN